jgi:MFS family permease
MKRFLLQALQGLGIVVFAVGISIVPLVAGLSVARWGYPWFALMIGLVSLALWVWLGDRFVLRPRQPRYGFRALASVILLIAFILGHPWVFGLPGRIGELRLEHSLRPGMTIAQVAELVHNVGGIPFDEQPRAITVHFIDRTTFCIEGGLSFTLDFDNRQILSSWHSDNWASGC